MPTLHGQERIDLLRGQVVSLDGNLAELAGGLAALAEKDLGDFLKGQPVIHPGHFTDLAHFSNVARGRKVEFVFQHIFNRAFLGRCIVEFPFQIDNPGRDGDGAKNDR